MQQRPWGNTGVVSDDPYSNFRRRIVELPTAIPVVRALPAEAHLFPAGPDHGEGPTDIANELSKRSRVKELLLRDPDFKHRMAGEASMPIVGWRPSTVAGYARQ